MKPYIKYWPAALVLLLIITNPSQTAFKNYLGRTSYQDLKRPLNLFIASEYSYRGDKYIGLAGNFIEVPRAHYEVSSPVVRRDSSTRVDTVKRDYDFSSFDKAVKN